jgi:hypothetical protein
MSAYSQRSIFLVGRYRQIPLALQSSVSHRIRPSESCGLHAFSAKGGQARPALQAGWGDGPLGGLRVRVKGHRLEASASNRHSDLLSHRAPCPSPRRRFRLTYYATTVLRPCQAETTSRRRAPPPYPRPPSPKERVSAASGDEPGEAGKRGPPGPPRWCLVELDWLKMKAEVAADASDEYHESLPEDD